MGTVSNAGRKDPEIPKRHRLLELSKRQAELYINGKQQAGWTGVYKHVLAPAEDSRHPHRMIYRNDTLVAHVWCRTGKEIPGGKEGDWEVFVQEEP